jgi:hypothetical protein
MNLLRSFAAVLVISLAGCASMATGPAPYAPYSRDNEGMNRGPRDVAVRQAKLARSSR